MIGAGLGIGFVTEVTAGVESPGVTYRPVHDLEMRIPMLRHGLANTPIPYATGSWR